jgi:hypothetical protein
MTEKKADPFALDDLIAPTSTTQEKKTPFQKLDKPNKLKPEIVIAVPYNKGFRDVAIDTCSNGEFIEWMKFVFPVEANWQEHEVHGLSRKLELITNIENFHAKCLFNGKKKELANN